MSFPLVRIGPKPPRGTRVLEQEADDALLALHVRRVQSEVRRRDGKCRWPEPHTCRFALEVVHVRDASLGGEYQHWNLILICAWIHRRGPESIHGKQLQIVRETPIEAEQPCFSFWRQGADGQYEMISREVAPFEAEKD